MAKKQRSATSTTILQRLLEATSTQDTTPTEESRHVSDGKNGTKAKKKIKRSLSGAAARSAQPTTQAATREFQFRAQVKSILSFDRAIQRQQEKHQHNRKRQLSSSHQDDPFQSTTQQSKKKTTKKSTSKNDSTPTQQVLLPPVVVCGRSVAAKVNAPRPKTIHKHLYKADQEQQQLKTIAKLLKRESEKERNS